MKRAPVVDAAGVGGGVERLAEGVRHGGREAVRKALHHLHLQGVIPGFAQRRLELTDAAVLRKRPQTLQHRARIGEIGVRFLEARSHGGGAGDGGTQQRTRVGVGQVAEPVRRQHRRAYRIVVDQIADGRVGEALAAAIVDPNPDVADESRFHDQIPNNFAL